MRIDWIKGPAPGIAGRARRTSSGFMLPANGAAEGASAAMEAERTASAAPLSPTSHDCAEQTDADASGGDREAAGHGQELLDALSDLQLAALDGHGGPALGRLADLAARGRQARDPGLQEVLQALAARAAVELARSE